MQTLNLMDAILDELSEILHQIDVEQIDSLQKAIRDADRLFIAGKGRTGLQMQAFGMRLMHIGLIVHVVDDVTTPNIQAGDLLIVGSGSGRTDSLTGYAQEAQSVGAMVSTIVGSRESVLAQAADRVITIPASNFKAGTKTSKESVLLMGSLFEHSLGLLCEIIILNLKNALDVSEGEMISRHANLE